MTNCVVKTAGHNHDQQCPNPPTRLMGNGEWLCDEHLQYVQDFEAAQLKDPDNALENACTKKARLSVIHTRIREIQHQRGTGVVN